MTIRLVTDEKIAETSSKGNQEKWYDHALDCWYKLDQFGYEALAEVVTSTLLERSSIEENTPFTFVRYQMERLQVRGGTDMNKKHKALLVFLVLSLALLCGCGGKSDEAPTETASEPETAGEPSTPEEPSTEEEATPIFITFEGTDLEGNPVSQEVFCQSRLTMVNVWATYCNPCLNEMSGLGELTAEYDPSEFQIIGIVSDVMEGEDQTLVESLVQETGAGYPHLLANDSIGQALLSSVSAVPTTFFFDGEGAYLGGMVGSAEKEQWEEIIHGLLEEQ